MSQAIQTSHLTAFPVPLPVAAQAASAAPMLRLATIVRGLASDLLCASDTRIVKIAAESAAGWGVEVEIFAPNPELTVSLRGGAKSILERSRYRLHFDLEMQLVALEPAEA
jgi:hypothetical protein